MGQASFHRKMQNLKFILQRSSCFMILVTNQENFPVYIMAYNAPYPDNVGDEVGCTPCHTCTCRMKIVWENDFKIKFPAISLVFDQPEPTSCIYAPCNSEFQ